jgi:hypothetical protein
VSSHLQIGLGDTRQLGAHQERAIGENILSDNSIDQIFDQSRIAAFKFLERTGVHGDVLKVRL